MQRIALAVVLLVSLAAPAWAGFNEGLEAHERGDYATALKEWRPLAEKGLAKAQYKLGIMYEWGQGVTQRYAEAVRWYHTAAEQGYLDAQITLGNMYRAGRGLPRATVDNPPKRPDARG